MKNLLKKQSAKFVRNPSSFTKVIAKHILVFFYAPQRIAYIQAFPKNGINTVSIV